MLGLLFKIFENYSEAINHEILLNSDEDLPLSTIIGELIRHTEKHYGPPAA